jgi:hypothetical protein
VDEGGGSNLSAAGDPARADEAWRQLVADPSLQFELKPFKAPQTPAWIKALSEFLERHGAVVEFLFWSVVIVGALFLLFLVARWLERSGFFDRFRRRGDKDEGEDWRPEEAPARALLGEADALAAAGRFGEAARLLLHRSIEEIDARRPTLVYPALTSRDIAGAPQLPPGPRSAFQRIVQAVERSLFGRSELGAGDWAACRAAYEEFAFAPEWGR